MTETVEPWKLDELPGFLVEVCTYPYYFYGINVDIIRYLLIFIYKIGYNKKKGKDGVCYVKKI